VNAAIQTENLSVQVGAKALLDGVSLAVAPGESLALVGPNGAGKSTLLRALSGEIAPSAGRVTLKGREPRSYRPSELARQRAVLAQQVSVAFPFSVEEIVRMGAGKASGLAVERLIDAALEEVDLAPLRQRIIGTLSGGEQQRAHFARILVQLRVGESSSGPGILMLDEPTSSLDLCHQLDLLKVIAACNANGTAIVITLHDLNLATLAARRVVVLDHGRVNRDGTVEDTLTEEVLRDVFNVEGVVNRVPAAGQPFILPHAARRRAT
jgi:iron complex transport system ATP-binding protein